MVLAYESGDMSRDETSGKYVEEYPPDRFIDAIAAEGGSADTRTITERVGCSRRLTSLRLGGLADEGRVIRQSVGNAYLWVLTEDTHE
jgi:hypothetical protein